MSDPNSLQQRCPEVLQYWDYGKNAAYSPDEITYGSNKKLWWRSETCGHEWQRMVKHQRNGNGCPTCGVAERARKRSATHTAAISTLAETHPELAAEWSPRNAFTPSDCTRNSYLHAYWICKTCGDEWRAIVSERAKGRGTCLLCKNHKVKVGVNDLRTTHSKLLEEWDYSKNEQDPSRFKFNDQAKAWWLCGKCGENFEAAIRNRAHPTRPSGCPACLRRQKVSRGQRQVYDFLKELGLEPVMSVVGFKGALEVDIYLRSLNLGIEYNGNYWHSDYVTQATKGITHLERVEAKVKTLQKTTGTRLVFVWDDDWREHQEEVKEALRRLVTTGEAEELLLKLDAGKQVVLREDHDRLDASGRRAYRVHATKLTEEQKQAVREGYLQGRSPGALATDLNLSRDACYRLVHVEGLIEERAARGISKNGSRRPSTVAKWLPPGEE